MTIKIIQPEEKIAVDIEKFILFHKDRISLLKELVKEKRHGRLIFQISFLGFESLAYLLFPNLKSKERFIKLLSTPNRGINEKEATELYEFWRNPLVHQGFIAFPYTCLENWGDDDTTFLKYHENKMRSSGEYPPESIIAIYENLTDYTETFFRKENIKQVEIK